MSELITQKTLWENFDPTAEPLDAVVVRSEVIDGLTFKQLYFTSTSFEDGTKTRVFAVVCHKGDKPSKNAVLLIDSYSKPISSDDLRFFAENGFTAMAIDLKGRVEKGKHTVYAPSEDFCNADVAKSLFYVDDGIRNNKLYRYAVMCMRAITHLIQNENAKNVSVVTVGLGTYVGTIVLAIDNRVTNGSIVFGAVYREYGNKKQTEADLSDREELAAHLAYEEKRQLWLMGLAPQSYVMQIKVPVYIITSANSELGNVEDISRMFYRINDESRLLVLPNTIEHLNDFYAKSVINWCKGKKPEEELSVTSSLDENGDYYVTTNSSATAKKLSVWYCVKADGRTKHWMRATITRTGGESRAKLNLYEKDCEVLVFALLDADVAISSPLTKIKVENAHNLILPSNIIFSGTGTQELIPFDIQGRWRGDNVSYEKAAGYLNIVGAKGNAFATYAISDRSIRRSITYTISFDVCCTVKQTLTVSVVHGFESEREVYSKEVQLLGDGKWQRIVVDEKDFKRDSDGKSIPADENCNLLMIWAKEQFIINNIIIV